MYGKFILSIFLIIPISCNLRTTSNSPTNSHEVNLIDTIETAYNFDSLYNIAFEKREIWFKSWRVDMREHDFRYDSRGELKSANQWTENEIDTAYLSLYKDLLFYSPDSLLFLDIYSYRVGLTKEGKTLVGVFDVDTKVVLVDIFNRKSRLLITAGTVANYDDCLWLDKNTFLLMGSYSEFIENKECFRPFILIYDVKNNLYCKYVFTNTIDKLNQQFFMKRYPFIKID